MKSEPATTKQQMLITKFLINPSHAGLETAELWSSKYSISCIIFLVAKFHSLKCTFAVANTYSLSLTHIYYRQKPFAIAKGHLRSLKKAKFHSY